MKRRKCSGAGSWSCLLYLGLLAASSGMLEAQVRRYSIDFLNEKLRSPDSELFNEEEYIESGVGLTFGVDRRLSYYAGQYEKAVRQFEKSIKRYPYKSEIWLYLARSYFLMKEPEKAQQVLEQAAEVMPDLGERFWEPLDEGLNREIRQRANHLQVQVDFYSKGQEDYLSLFRFYRFLEDYPAASGVIHAAEDRARHMKERASMSSGNSQRTFRNEVQKWQDLGKGLRAEMLALGVEVVGDPKRDEEAVEEEAEDENAELVEATRLLQLRVNFYQFLVGSQDYQTLFDNYLILNQPDEAAGVIEAMDQAIKRVDLEILEAGDIQEELDLRDKAAELEKLRKVLQERLDADEEEEIGNE